MTSGRNSIGVEIDEGFQHFIRSIPSYIVDYSNGYLSARVRRHLRIRQKPDSNLWTVEIQKQALRLSSSNESRTVYFVEWLKRDPSLQR